MPDKLSEISCPLPRIQFILASGTQKDSFPLLETIAINLRDNFDSIEQVIANDWQTLNELSTHLPHIPTVVLGFRSREDVSYFVSEVVDATLGTLLLLGKLRYAVADKVGTKWFRVSPNLDILEGVYILPRSLPT